MNLNSILLILLLLGCAQTGLIKPETGIIDNERAATADPQQAMLEQARAFKESNPELFGKANGVLVTAIVSDSQGEKAGLKPGDILLTYSNTFLNSVEHLIELNGKRNENESITLTYLRNKELQEVDIQGGRIGLQIVSLIPSQSELLTQSMSDLSQQGDDAISKARYETAVLLYQKGLKIANDLENSAWRSVFLRGLGNVYYYRGQYLQALDYYQQSLAITREIGDRNGEANNLNNLGNAYIGIGQYPQALDLYQQSLAIQREINDRNGEANSLGNLGNLYRNLGQYPQALEHNQQSLAITREIGDRNGEAINLSNLGSIYYFLGQNPQALDHYQQSLAIHRETGDRNGEAKSLLGLGNVYHYLDQYPQALDLYQQSLVIQREIGDRKGEANSLGNLGNIYQNLGQYPQALEHNQQSLAIKREIDDRNGEAKSLLNLGNVYQDLGQYPQAFNEYRQALSILVQVDVPESIWRVWSGLSKTSHKLGQLQIAIFTGKQAVNTLQSMRASNLALERELQTSFLEEKVFVYQRLAEMLIEQGRLAEAEQVMAMLKEDEYFDFIQRDGQDDMRITQAGYTQMENGIVTEINQFSSQLVSLGKEYKNLEKLSLIDEQAKVRLTKVEKELEQAQAGFLKLISGLENYFKQAGSDKALELGERQLERLESQQGMLGKHQAVIITTIVTKEKIHLLLTTPEVQLARESAIGEKALNDLIKRFRNALKHPGSDPVPLAQELYTYLVKPLEKDLQQAQVETLMWSLDGALRYVPLATLHDGQQFLIEKYGLSLYTAAAHNNLHENNVGSWRAAGLGVSLAHPGFEALPAVPNELRNIIRKNDDDQIGVLSGEIHLDRDFNRETFKSVVRAGYPVLHIASHFKLQPGDGSASKLLLGDGDTLSLDEFRRQAAFKLHGVDLLTLSACDTAVGDKGAGGEVESFAVMAQLRGANGVLASLWRVEDESTALLMQQLYRLLSGDGRLSKAEALRQAQIKLLRGEIRSNKNGEKFSHPYFWAPFVMMGNWL
ncbi:MAG: tetratricopeptide repeat protein [Cellvibrio sp.]|uniref:tetratricopeptide repeat protein n=1 Tax=Cellvibrio sp. TaxID=1965322 RepID=UPI002728DC8D|nr:tetratricopeptide repeat protein [Cellvibrio sp.]